MSSELRKLFKLIWQKNKVVITNHKNIYIFFYRVKKGMSENPLTYWSVISQMKWNFINGGERVNPNINLVKNEVKLLASFIYRIETAMASLCQEEITTRKYIGKSWGDSLLQIKEVDSQNSAVHV